MTGGFQATAGAKASTYEVSTATLKVDPKDIECGKGQMNRKLRDALDSKTDATIQFSLTQASNVDLSSGPKAAKLSGTLRIAGKTIPVVVNATGSMSATNQIQFEGSTKILMSDYDIDPPTALLGTLKTGNEITIRFLMKAAQDN